MLLSLVRFYCLIFVRTEMAIAKDLEADHESGTDPLNVDAVAFISLFV